MPGKVGVASGLILGLTFSAGGFGAFFIGQLANNVGLSTALSLAAILPIIALFLFLTIPAHVMQLTRPQTEARQPTPVGANEAGNSARR
jgi:FSR family fosmidomycin resistance protein-like MFS transporter